METQVEVEQDSRQLLQAMRILRALDTHGPKVLVYLIAAELLGAFEWLTTNAAGICG
jgi:hypothetical protein